MNAKQPVLFLSHGSPMTALGGDELNAVWAKLASRLSPPAAILSVSIGLMNLFPVPMLDGGHLLFYAIEALRGKPLSERAQEIGFRLGLGLVLMLMLFVTWNDLVHVRSLL